MKVGFRPEGPLEWLAATLDLAPIPVADTHVAFTAARAIMAGTSLGIFDAIAEGARTSGAIAAACGTDPSATRALVDCLVALGYLRITRGRYSNARHVERWLLARSPHSVRDKILFQELEWELVAKLEEFVRTGKGLDLHHTLSSWSSLPRENGWRLYSKAMRAMARSAAPALAAKLRLPRHAEQMLDVGGSHGLYSLELCRLHPALRSAILDLSIPEEAPRLGDRITYRRGDVLDEELGDQAYDVVLANNLVHHLTGDQNQDLARRAARALRPGGIFVIGDLERRQRTRAGDALGGTLNLYFALVSTSGLWPLSSMRRWQATAGLEPLPVTRIPRMPGFVLQVGCKPKRSAR